MTAVKETRAPRVAPAWVPSWAFLAICCVAQFMVVLDRNGTGFHVDKL